MSRGPLVDRLTLRLALGTTVLVVLLLAAGLYVVSSQHYRRSIEARKQAAESQNQVLEVALRHQMPKKDKSLINKVLGEVASQPGVRDALIVDHDGVVQFSGRPEQVGQKISRDSPTCQVCHGEDPAYRERSVVIDAADGQFLRSVLPIENRPECHKCHNPAQRINGMLLMDVSLAEVQQRVESDQGWMATGTAALAGLLLLGVGISVRQLALVRLARLGKAARSIAAGKLSERVVVDGNDTITELGMDFNNMAGAVESLVSEVQSKEAHLSNVMNSLDDGLVVLDRQLRVVAANQAFCRRASLHPEAICGMRCREAVPTGSPCGLSGGQCVSSRCFSTGKPQRATIERAGADGKPIRVEEIQSSPAFDDEGNVVEVVEVWRDITERVEEENRLAEFGRLESLGMLASGFSHEMNTPLASSLTCAEGILRSLEAPAAVPGPEVKDLAEIIRREVLRCRRITEEFLRFSRGVPPSTEPVDLPDVVASILSVAKLTAREAGVTLQAETPEGLPPVAANREVVQHVLLNLLVNAIQAFEVRGGTVKLTYEVGPDVRVRIRDNGRGMPRAALAHLFEPFRTSRPNGTGIGLFLSRRFMRRIGGEVRLVESEPGVGSCFEVVFPRAKGAGQ